MTVLPSLIYFASSSNNGGRTFSITSDDANNSSLETRVAPAAEYCSSRNCAPAPALISTSTFETPFFFRSDAFAGVNATRRSFGNISLGMPMVRDE